MVITHAFYEPDTEMMHPKTSKGNISETYVFAAHGVEVGIIPVAPAIANAIFDAVGIRLKDLPFTCEKVLAAVKNRDE